MVSNPTMKAGSPPLSLADLRDQAAALLVEIAGQEPLHGEMNMQDKDGAYLKYGYVRRPFALEDARDHLSGKKTKAARLLRPDGLTRALCFDADNADDWYTLREAAHMLASAGYLVLVEDSPIGRGGHLWIIYTDLVDTRCALRHVRQIAPQLEGIAEYWPHLKQNVRLPGGVYVTPEFREQCKLYDAMGRQVASTRQEAAAALLAYQTPAGLVPDYPPEPEPEKKSSCITVLQLPAAPGAVQFSNADLARWFNSRHSLESIHPLETPTHARATWRHEKGRPSVSYLQGGRWYDHGHAEQKSGDALDLYILVSGRSKAEVLRELGREYRAEVLGGLPAYD